MPIKAITFPIKILIAGSFLIFLSGCWNSLELTDLAYVMGVGIDQTEEGQIELTTQMYSPTQTVGAQGGSSTEGRTYFSVITKDESVFEAIRDIPLHVGRKAQWSHMRIILIGEEFARKNDISDVLDFFYRDHEPRFLSHVIITKGRTSDYWNIKPFIEKTTAQQLRTIQESGTAFSSKSKETRILDLALQLNYQLKLATVPYIERTNQTPESVVSTGLAIVSDGKMHDRISTADVHNLLILTDDYNSGTIEYPCQDKENQQKNRSDTLEVTQLKTKLSPNFSESPPTIHFSTKVEGHIGEFQCSTMATDEERQKLQVHIENALKTQLEAFITYLQDEKLDVIGIGNTLYRKDPKLWEKQKENWEQIFSEIKFEIDVEIIIKSTGMTTGADLTEG
ncbi:Ger(x)C family spore germination protein [Halalkalibacter lacteus]|uniref:Ger(x)C family spore germination protein n=1 Tax=Halalkalibacter lacteus TaxID=3090663 RepID=UPI002FCA8086